MTENIPFTTKANENRLAYAGAKPGAAKSTRAWGTPHHILEIAREVVGGNFYSTYLMGQREALAAALASGEPAMILTVNNTDARVHRDFLRHCDGGAYLTKRLAFLGDDGAPVKGNTRGSVLYLINTQQEHRRVLVEALERAGQKAGVFYKA